MIEKCFRCEGLGEIHDVDPDKPGHYSGSMALIYRKWFPCPRCLGSGAIDYRIVEAVPVEKLQAAIP